MDLKHDIILFHYTFSPYARRVVWYLNLRKIPYSQCIQPPTLPRPDLQSLSISHRRIPLLSINNTIYIDTRLILSILDSLFPPSSAHPFISPLPSSPNYRLHNLFLKLAETWTVDGGVFNNAARLIPSDLPTVNNEKFRKDREDFTGGRGFGGGREEAVGEVKRWCGWIEELLGDGRECIFGEGGVGRADIEVIWPFHWLTTLPGALPPTQISPTQFPHLFTYLSRFDTTIRQITKANGKPPTLTGLEAKNLILSHVPSSSSMSRVGIYGQVLKENGEGAEIGVEGGWVKGEEVEVWPIDTGMTHRDRGELVGIDGEKVVVRKRENGVLVVVPKHGFRVKKVSDGAKL